MTNIPSHLVFLFAATHEEDELAEHIIARFGRDWTFPETDEVWNALNDADELDRWEPRLIEMTAFGDAPAEDAAPFCTWCGVAHASGAHDMLTPTDDNPAAVPAPTGNRLIIDGHRVTDDEIDAYLRRATNTD